MLHVPVGANTFCLTTPSWGTSRPASANGTSVTPGTSGYGTYTQILSALSADAYGLLVNVNSWSASANSRNGVIKIGIDEAGGSSYTDRITGLLIGNAAPYNTGAGGVWYFFPMLIPAGSTVAVAGHGSVSTAFRCGLVALGRPAQPSMIRKGSFVETLGISGITGTALTPGTTSDGAWTSIGTTTNRCWWWQLAVQVDAADTTWVGNSIHVDLAVGDGSNKDIIIQDLLLTTTTNEQASNPPLTAGVEWDTPAGSTIYMRAQTSGNLDSYTAAAYGLGG